MKLVDTHCHLHMDYYKKDREQVIQRAYENNVMFMLTVGISASDSIKAVELAEKYEKIYACVGVHPHDAKSVNQNDVNIIRKLLAREKVLAIGEIGLDFYRNLSPRQIQIEVFETFMQLALETGYPVVIHTRDAHKETKAILKKYPDVKGVIHCFSGNKEDAKDYLDMGYFISFAGNVTYNKELEEAARFVPIEKILIETDAPFLTPVPLRGKRNEPAYVKYTLAKLSIIKKKPPEEIVEAVISNINTLWGLTLQL